MMTKSANRVVLVTKRRTTLIVAALALAVTAVGAAQTPAPAPVTLFQNVRVFNGTSETLSGPTNVLVRGNIIEKIGASAAAAPPDATIIDGGGRTLMPGLIDAHWHTMFVGPPLAVVMTADADYLAAVAGDEAERALMRGFTTVRDIGGASFGLKRAIDEGVLPGPRIYPSGAMISVTSGHGDFREAPDLPRQLGGPGSRHDVAGNSAIADSPDEVRLRAREQLFRGASQVKLTAGGGVASPHSPLDALTFTSDELRAAVEAARNWGTYVSVHAYTSEAVRQAIDAGVLCIEHASLMDEDTAKLMAAKSIWLSAQPFPQELGEAFPPGSDQRQKFDEVYAGAQRAYELAHKHKVKTAFGTDVLFSSALAAQQGRMLASLTRWYTPGETLVMATGTNGELLRLSGKRNPYKGDVGVVREGALADLLLVDGNPLENLKLIEDPGRNFVIIMKDGRIYKNLLRSAGTNGASEPSGGPRAAKPPY